YLLIFLFITIMGIYFTGEANKIAGEKDKNIFSLDEVPGQLISFLPLYYYSEHRIILLFIGLALFRFFDIVKPGIIKKSEDLPSGYGVVIDDVLSGIFAAFCLQIIILFL
ncbi:MAG: phosphatidylglycerophosphatase A, partial [Candidatus Margulisbacteria bacterium]|nr:phosphatidylglycerophosphatase A [Candidatus Margulisiibacteriota bacterium]